jgi:hypothetical protein
LGTKWAGACARKLRPSSLFGAECSDVNCWFRAGKSFVPPFILGKTARNLDASEILWEFFAPFAVTLHAKSINEPTSEAIDN